MTADSCRGKDLQFCKSCYSVQRYGWAHGVQNLNCAFTIFNVFYFLNEYLVLKMYLNAPYAPGTLIVQVRGWSVLALQSQVSLT